MNDLPPAYRDWLVTKVTMYEQIAPGDLESNASASQAPALHELRAEVYRETFPDYRNHFLEHLVPKT